MSRDIHPEACIHPHALVEPGASIGARTRVWAFAHVLPDVVIGDDCNICDQTLIEGNVRVGNRVTIKCGVYLWDGVTIEDDVFVGPAVVFTNDLTPRSRQHPHEYVKTLLRQGCSIGANATILAGLNIGRWAMVGAGAMVAKAVPDYALVVGVPARQVGWVCCCGQRLELAEGRRGVCTCGRRYEPDAATLGIVEVEHGP